MTPLDRLHARLATLGPIAVAVSGGVNSLTLATAAHRALGAGAMMYHAMSPSVPLEATNRTRALAAVEGWQLEVFEDAFRDSTVYDAISRRTTRQIVAGTNLDDLAEHQKTIETARRFGVRNPFVEAEIDQATVRRIAANLGLATPTDSQTAPNSYNGMAVAEVVHQAERLVADRLSPRIVRAHLSAPNGVRCVVIELDEQTLARLDATEAEHLQLALQTLAASVGVQTVAFSASKEP